MTTPPAPGTIQEVDGGRLARAYARFEEDLRVAALAGDHVWTAIVSHRVSEQRIQALAAGSDEPGLLDAESVISVGVGCYRCEEPFHPRMVGRRCRAKS